MARHAHPYRQPNFPQPNIPFHHHNTHPPRNVLLPRTSRKLRRLQPHLQRESNGDNVAQGAGGERYVVE